MEMAPEGPAEVKCPVCPSEARGDSLRSPNCSHWHKSVVVSKARGQSIWHKVIFEIYRFPIPYPLSEEVRSDTDSKINYLLLLLLINNSLCEICRFSSFEGGDGVCFPNTGCFLTQIISRDLFSYKDRWLWRKNQVTLFCREDSTWGLTECLKPLSDSRGPLERRGCLYGCYCMQHKLNPAGSVDTVCSFDCRVSSLLFISVFSVWIRWVPQIWHLLCVEPFISGGMEYHSELLHRKPKAGKWIFFFFCGEKQILMLASTLAISDY